MSLGRAATPPRSLRFIVLARPKLIFLGSHNTKRAEQQWPFVYLANIYRVGGVLETWEGFPAFRELAIYEK